MSNSNAVRSKSVSLKHQVIVRKPSVTQKIEAQLSYIVQEAREQKFTGTYSIQLHCQSGGVADVTISKEQIMRM